MSNGIQDAEHRLLVLPCAGLASIARSISEILSSGNGFRSNAGRDKFCRNFEFQLNTAFYCCNGVPVKLDRMLKCVVDLARNNGTELCTLDRQISLCFAAYRHNLGADMFALSVAIRPYHQQVGESSPLLQVTRDLTGILLHHTGRVSACKPCSVVHCATHL